MYRTILLTGLVFSAAVSYAQPFSGFVALDGSNDYAETAGAGAILPSGQDFTVETWVRSCGMTGYIVDARDALSGEGLALSVVNPGAIRVTIQGSGGPASLVDTLVASPLSSTGWQHVALTFDQSSGDIQLFVSGRSFASFTADFSPSTQFSLGRDASGAGPFFDGYLDEFRVSNVVRYTVPFNPAGPFADDAQTLALWHFDEAAGTTSFADASGAGHDLTPRMGASPGRFFNVSGGGPVCSGATASISASGGISYSWSPVTGLDDPTSANPTATPVETTYYVVTALDSNSCTSLGLVQVEVREEPEALATAAQPLICNGSITQIFAEGGVSYLWNFGAISQNPFVNPEETTTYTVVVTDAFGCSAEAAVTVAVEECSNTTGIADPNTFSLNVGPNPTWGSLWVNLALTESSEMRWTIYDASGRLVRQYATEWMAAGLHQRTLETDLDNGQYWLILESNENKRSLPFTVLR
jgi:hypothetical protein